MMAECRMKVFALDLSCIHFFKQSETKSSNHVIWDPMQILACFGLKTACFCVYKDLYFITWNGNVDIFSLLTVQNNIDINPSCRHAITCIGPLGSGAWLADISSPAGGAPAEACSSSWNGVAPLWAFYTRRKEIQMTDTNRILIWIW